MMIKKYIFIFFVLINIPTSYSKNLPTVDWELYEHSYILTSRILDSLGWKNENAKFLVIKSNLSTDIWDISAAAFNQPWYSFSFLPQVVSHFKYKDTNIPQILSFCYSDDPEYGFWLRKSKLINHYEENLIGGTSSSRGFHFDNLFRYELIIQRWEDINKWAKESSKELVSNNLLELTYWFSLIGMITHAVQDFYCHSNWTLLASYYGTKSKTISSDSIPTWEEFNDKNWSKNNPQFDCKTVKDMFSLSNNMTSFHEFYFDKKTKEWQLEGGLQTGNICSYLGFGKKYFEYPIKSKSYPWKHRHPGNRSVNENDIIINIFHDPLAPSKEYKTAMHLAIRATIYWVNYLLSSNVLTKTQSEVLQDYIILQNNIIVDRNGKKFLLNKEFWSKGILNSID